MNGFHLTGYLTHTPEIKSAGSTQVSEFQLSVKNHKGESEFFRLTAFGKTAETLVRHKVKGDWVGVDGKLQMDTWEQDGKKRSKVKLIVFALDFGPKTGARKPDERPARRDDDLAPRDDQEEIPF